MDIIIDEILYLYFQGYYLNEILDAIKNNQKPQKKNRKKVFKAKEESIKKNQCLNLNTKKSKYSESFSKLDIKE